MVEDDRASAKHERRFNTAHRTSAPPDSAANAVAPTQPPPNLQPANIANLSVGDSVVVHRALWPTYSCHENSGAGWSATVRRLSRTAVRVSFDTARTRDNRRYQDELVPPSFLSVYL